MNMPERIVLIGPSRQAVIAAVRDLGIPPLQLERRSACRLIGDSREDTDPLRGMADTDWALLPGHTMSIAATSFVRATLRRIDRPFHELIAHHLAWRLWHDC